MSAWKIVFRRSKGLALAIFIGVALAGTMLSGLEVARAGETGRNTSNAVTGNSLWENMGVYGGFMQEADFDPDTGTIYVVGNGYPGLYFSNDNGEHWQGIDPGYAAAQRVIVAGDGSLYANFNTLSRSTDGGQTWVDVVNTSQAQYSYTMQDFDVDRNDPAHIVIGTAAAGSQGDGAVYVTWDGGESWSAAQLDIPTTSDVFSVAIDPVDGQVVYAISRDENINSTLSQVYRSADGGENFTPVLQATSGDQFFTVRVSSSQTVFAGSNGKMYRSLDGQLWERVAENFNWASFISFAPNDPDTVYTDGFVSHDNGETWEGFSASQFLAISPDDPNLMFTGTGLGVQRSTDGGVTWENKVQGIENLLIWEALSDPADNQVMYFSSGNGVGRTFDSGRTWDFPVMGINFSTPLAVHPAMPGMVLALNGPTLAISHDYMDTWSYHPITSLVYNSITDIAVDPQDAQRIFIAESGHNRDLGYNIGSLHMTEDGGQSWRAVPEFDTLPVNEIKAGKTVEGNTVIYAAVGDGFGYNEGRGGVYRSNDLGNSWQRVGLADQMVGIVEIDPIQGDIIYAGVYSNAPGDIHLLFRSRDGGDTWDQLPLEVMGGVGSIGIDPENPHKMFASTSNLLYESNDQGDCWRFYYQGDPGEQFLAIHLPLLPPPPVREFKAQVEQGEVVLEWYNPDNADFAGVNIRVLTDTFPTAHSMGYSLTLQTGAPGEEMVFTHTDVISETTYFYSIFAFDSDGRFSAPTSISATLGASTLTGWAQGLIPASGEAEEIDQVVYLSTSKGLYRKIEISEDEVRLFLPVVIRRLMAMDGMR